MAQSLTYKAIDACDELMDAMTMAEENRVDIGGLEDMDDILERLRMQVRLDEEGPMKEKIEKSMRDASNEVQCVCNKLIEILKETKKIFTPKSDPPDEDDLFIHNMLREDGISDNILHSLDKEIATLQDTECRILVAGETSSGKSTFLNLLFDDDLLPTNILSSTSTVTLVRYGIPSKAKISLTGGREEMITNFDGVGRERLTEVTFIRDRDRIGNHEVQEVEVYLDNPLLSGGVVFVDTPGIGESEFLEERLLKYISENTVHGFIYVIKTDQAGGVQDDRIISLLKMVLEQYKEKGQQKGLSKFFPRSAMFICNRFDLIEEGEREKVRKNAVEELGKCWPNFDDTQVHFFSASKEKSHVKANAEYISRSYKKVIDGIRDLYRTALNQRVHDSYKWLQNLIRRSTHFSKTMISRLGSSDRELKEQSEDTKAKLDVLRQKSDDVIRRLRADIEVTTNEVAEKVKAFIDKPISKEKLTQKWKETELPPPEEQGVDWGWIKSKIDEAFYDRLGKLLLDWDDENKVICHQETKISRSIKHELNLLDHELSHIEFTMDGTSSTRSIYPSHVDLRPYESKIPFELAAALFARIQRKVDHAKVKAYVSNPVKVAEKRALKLYMNMVSGRERDVLIPFVQQLLDRPYGYIDVLEKEIPKLIRSNQHLLLQVMGKRSQKEKSQEVYRKKVSDLFGMRKSLAEFGDEYLFVNDLKRYQIRVRRTVSGGGSFSESFDSPSSTLASSHRLRELKGADAPQGLWTVTEYGYLSKDEQSRRVTIKMYRPSARIEQTSEESRKLRCLIFKEMHLAEYRGSHHADTLKATFIFEGRLWSLRRFCRSPGMNNEKVGCILTQVAQALLYLQQQHMVHMELNKNTITVDANGNVHLTGMCLSRKATFPDNLGTETADFVYIAPEVLKGQVYTSAADIYCYGLLLLELFIFPDGVFREQRTWDLNKFISSVNPVSMMALDVAPPNIEPSFWDLIQECVDMEREDRPDTSYVVSEVEAYFGRGKHELPERPTVKTQGSLKRTRDR